MLDRLVNPSVDAARRTLVTVTDRRRAGIGLDRNPDMTVFHVWLTLEHASR